MASSSSVNVFVGLFLLFALHSHARDLQSFNKISAADNADVYEAAGEPYKKNPEKSEPSFLPETQNAYGLYRQNSEKETVAAGQFNGVEQNDFDSHLPDAGAQFNGFQQNDFDRHVPDNGGDFDGVEKNDFGGHFPDNAGKFNGVEQNAGEFNGDFSSRHLPKNYNPVAYVTQPEDFKDSGAYKENNFYAVDSSEELDEIPKKYGYDSYGGDGHGANYNYNAAADSQRLSSTSLSGASAFAASGDALPQGMSDTRAVENGKYFYDVNAEKFNSNHPYEALKEGYNGNRYFVSNRRNYGNSFAGENSGAGETYGNFWP